MRTTLLLIFSLLFFSGCECKNETRSLSEHLQNYKSECSSYFNDSSVHETFQTAVGSAPAFIVNSNTDILYKIVDNQPVKVRDFCYSPDNYLYDANKYKVFGKYVSVIITGETILKPMPCSDSHKFYSYYDGSSAAGVIDDSVQYQALDSFEATRYNKAILADNYLYVNDQSIRKIKRYSSLKYENETVVLDYSKYDSKYIVDVMSNDGRFFAIADDGLYQVNSDNTTKLSDMSLLSQIPTNNRVVKEFDNNLFIYKEVNLEPMSNIIYRYNLNTNQEYIYTLPKSVSIYEMEYIDNKILIGVRDGYNIGFNELYITDLEFSFFQHTDLIPNVWSDINTSYQRVFK